MRRYVIALYIRLSMEDSKTESMSIRNQRIYLLDHAMTLPEYDNTEILEFIDNGHTGANFERPAVQELLDLVRSGKMDCILVKDFSRFGRNSIETGYFIERVFPIFHTRFISVSDDFDSANYKGDTGGLDVAIILRNEKYVGDLLLQKTYVEDHLTKKKMINDGALPMYYVEDNHEPIVSREDFDRVQAMRKARAAIYHPSTATPVHYPFTSMIRCGQCGQHYRRAINSAGTKYAKTVWPCPTYDKHGKAACPSKKIPESILEAVTADALGLPAFDAEAFAVAVREIVVVEAGRLAYLLHDGRTIEKTWEHASRAASWDDEARQRARDKALMNAQRRKES